jgi:carbon starvation protein
VGTVIFVPALFFSVWLGTVIPCDLQVLFGCSAAVATNIWLCVLFAYVFVASTIPVWLLLQPRDYLNSYLLYAMIVLGFLGVLFYRPDIKMPAFVGFSATDPKGNPASLFPLLFVTVACGACSGFHALVASGTSAKQVSSEKEILPVGYGGMLVEGALAVMALISVAYLSRENYNEMLVAKSPVAAFANGLATFAAKLGVPIKTGTTFMALAISAFMLTTLDTATRLTRFTWQELFLPKSGESEIVLTGTRRVFANPFVATAIAVISAGFLAFSGGGMTIWPVFGASNQLLAALTLLSVTLFLLKRKLNFWIAFLPMIFMLVISGWALIVLLGRTWGTNAPLFVATQVLLALALVLAIQAARSLKKATHDS